MPSGLPRGLQEGDEVQHLVHGHTGARQEREQDGGPVHYPPAIAGAFVPRRQRGP